MAFIADMVRLPKDPPRTLDTGRLTPKMIFNATQPPLRYFEECLMPLAKAAGIPDLKRMQEDICTPSNWEAGDWKKKIVWIHHWLYLYHRYT